MDRSLSLKYFVVILIIILLVAGIAFYLNQRQVHRETYIYPVSITGDLEAPFLFTGAEDFERVEIDYRGAHYRVYRMDSILKKAAPRSDNFDLILLARDGLAAKISGLQLEEAYLNYSAKYGWEAINLKHPVSSNVKEIEKIIITANDTGTLPEEALRIISPEEDFAVLTAGQLLGRGTGYYPYLEGIATVEDQGLSYQNEKYNWKNVIDLEELLEGESADRILLLGSRGESLVYRDGLLEISGNQINYFDPERDQLIEDLRGIVLDAPLNSIQDIYHDSLYYLEQDERVLIILLDGFGYYQYLYCLDNEHVPFLASLPEARKVMSVFKPVTNAGLAATLTGVGPDENGVYSRKQKDLKSADIFQKAKELGKDSIYIEGNIKILNTSIEPELNPDLNKNGMTDDEVYESALKAIEKDAELIYVHFHGIDDYGHQYGPLAAETMEMIGKTDSYLRELITRWPGKVLITADHGMHQTEEGGDHGIVSYQDLFVPYIIIDGGGSQ